LFVGRQTELDVLKKCYRSDTSELCVIYGRRRIGKTTLIEQFAVDKSCFFFLAGRETKRLQLNRFVKELGQSIDDPLTGQTRVNNWDEALLLLDRSIVALVQRFASKKAIVVFDEFQWMCQGANELLSDLQRYWDTRWRKTGNLFLILCGSSVSFMVGDVLSRKSPLFGRRTQSLALAPFRFAETAEFFPRKSRLEIAEYYLCLGGIPKYLEIVASSKGFKQTIQREAFSKTGFFFDEIQLVLSEQLKEKEIYFRILQCIALGSVRVADLQSSIGIASGQLNHYLERLQLLAFISRHAPFGAPLNTNKIRYHLDDYYLRFYFSFIHPNLERIKRARNSISFDGVTKNRWNSFSGLAYEQVARDHASAISLALGYEAEVVAVGSYWQRPTKRKKGVQIDLIIDLNDECILVCECEWSRGKVGVSAADELLSKIELFPNRIGKTLVPVLVTTAGTTAAVRRRSDVSVVTLDDLFR